MAAGIAEPCCWPLIFATTMLFWPLCVLALIVMASSVVVRYTCGLCIKGWDLAWGSCSWTSRRRAEVEFEWRSELGRVHDGYLAVSRMEVDGDERECSIVWYEGPSWCCLGALGPRGIISVVQRIRSLPCCSKLHHHQLAHSGTRRKQSELCL